MKFPRRYIDDSATKLAADNKFRAGEMKNERPVKYTRANIVKLRDSF